MEAEWRPANSVESDMQAALEAGDGARYAQLLRGATLYLPTHDNGAAAWPEWMPPVDADQTVVFTSPEALFGVFGPAATGYRELDLAALRVQYGDPDRQLVIDPGTPVGVFLSFNDIDELASGQQQLMAMQDVEDAVVDEVLDEVREMVLAELGSDAETAARALDEGSANELEARLLAAVDEQNFDEFVFALVTSEVVVPTERAVPDAEQLAAHGFPWRVVGGEQSPVIPVFTSAEVLDRMAPSNAHRVQLPFLTLLTNWPSEDHVLLVNPGTPTELTLPGPGVADLRTAAEEATREQ
ncbi:SseB family protein [Saccharopolyspora sp. K220]|uniref:SseB family protein n=1 Tax=Saccharopolyspora soli TaxID=2926618 RepID=UPI001F57AA53|nr:SseB family protein [Saccharopolyspora soli]MCI2421203.1 SseB family protein [Saccharopolyspora soli]